MKVTHVAWDMHGRNLPHPFAILVEMADHSGDDQRSVADALSKANKVAIGLDLLSMAGEVQNSLLLFACKNRMPIQAVEERLEV
jgi:hypothetical protein